jgi:hypothetical protein
VPANRNVERRISPLQIITTLPQRFLVCPLLALPRYRFSLRMQLSLIDKHITNNKKECHVVNNNVYSSLIEPDVSSQVQDRPVNDSGTLCNYKRYTVSTTGALCNLFVHLLGRDISGRLVTHCDSALVIDNGWSHVLV